MTFDTAIEIIATILNFCFLILVIRENIWCWLFGILGSMVSIYLFIETKLYSESILYSYYVIMGFYGWRKWSSNNKDSPLNVSEVSLLVHLGWITLSISFALALGWFFSNHTDANNPYFDAFTTVFAFLATYFEAIKLRSAWFYWIAINGLSVWLYMERGLEIYSVLMLIYFILSFVGLHKWQKSYRKSKMELL
ncbi:MAG: nicotinamide mononucleotide transporter [Ignavibacteriae bacterium]|nr:nicotinamide mononucleotide transporter [Ignavibacteriota bacterium]MCB9221188.1 nicotinamide mononucleotide transporter [Ignavibacteria bacterium]